MSLPRVISATAATALFCAVAQSADPLVELDSNSSDNSVADTIWMASKRSEYSFLPDGTLLQIWPQSEERYTRPDAEKVGLKGSWAQSGNRVVYRLAEVERIGIIDGDKMTVAVQMSSGEKGFFVLRKQPGSGIGPLWQTHEERLRRRVWESRKPAAEFAKNEEAQPVAAPSPSTSSPADKQEEPAVQFTSRDNILTVLETGRMSEVLEGSGTLVGFEECKASIRGDFVSGIPAPHTVTCRLDSNSKGVRFYQDCKKTDFAGDIASLLAKVEAGEPIDATTPQQIKEHIGRQVRIRSVDDYCESFEMLQ
jgi:hypothetical protein